MNKNDFIEVQIEICDKQEADVLGQDKASTDVAIAMIRLDDISYYREDPGTESDPIERTVVSFRNGQELAILLNLLEFEKLIFNAK